MPTAMVGLAGETVIDSSAAAVTVRVALPLMVPTAALTVVAPVDNVLARPIVLTVAIAGDDDVQTAVSVKFCVLPSE